MVACPQTTLGAKRDAAGTQNASSAGALAVIGRVGSGNEMAAELKNPLRVCNINTFSLAATAPPEVTFRPISFGRRVRVSR